VNYERTRVRSPVNGYVTNLTAQLGNYADVGALQLSVVNSDSYWVDAYFEETALSRIQEGDAATVKLMGYTPLLHGRVQGLARGIDVPNSAPDASGLASVNPIFTFVRLAQRVPVRIHIDEVPDDIKLVAGMTATVQIEPYKAQPLPDSKPASGKVSGADTRPASFQTLTDAPLPPTAAPQAAKPATAMTAPPAQPASRSATQAAQGPAAPQAVSSPIQQMVASPGPAPASAVDQLSVSIPPSAQATAAADAASADLKALQQQIAANPPAGAGSAKSDGGMPSSEFLGQTYDLFGGPNVTPRPRSPDTIRRRARSRWRHLPPRSP
jgi:hypothetical protein